MADVEVIVNDQSVSAILDNGVTVCHSASFRKDKEIGEFPDSANASNVMVDDGSESDRCPSGGHDVQLDSNSCDFRRSLQTRCHQPNPDDDDVTENSVSKNANVDRNSSGDVHDHQCDPEVDDRGRVTTDSGLLAAVRRKKHRRGKSKKRKWKPYNKLTWDEKRELEDREARRAHRVREERFAHGQPVAPYNTTQFLMEDHNVQEPDLDNIVNGHRQHRESTGTLDSDEYYSSPEDEEEFLQKEFCEVYDNIHAERLSSMTKLELIQEYMHLEDRVEKLEQRLRGELDRVQQQEGVTTTDSAALEKILIFQQEVHKLTEENDRLRRENDLLKHDRCLGCPMKDTKDEPATIGQVMQFELMEQSGN